MMKAEEWVAMRAIALCFKPYLKPEEALIYTNLERTQFAKNCEKAAIFKTDAGYYEREQLDAMMRGEQRPLNAALERQTGGKSFKEPLFIF